MLLQRRRRPKNGTSEAAADRGPATAQGRGGLGGMPELIRLTLGPEPEAKGAAAALMAGVQSNNAELGI